MRDEPIENVDPILGGHYGHEWPMLWPTMPIYGREWISELLEGDGEAPLAVDRPQVDAR